ncbi:3'(2'),5'-bisphosphate nucleotidase CysQ family protein [Candidatus Laterigemmans baculatus]|uniref:3'(2'),5'-bisphosphate nucleotidase CysQ family protein n=1 Tax=Candidatus Laterigemmans baculatus TaxID=2770505 RepID=UPI0013DB8834|nr:3'(2'),5'-bisphosphate nucleotidase CysQ [Candidatus Laterigemmans baculatus]
MFPTLIDIARRGGEAILAHYGSDPGTVLKGDDSPLTLADMASHRMICAALAEAFPEIPICSEEGMENGTVDPAGRFWSVDPLDGTKEFLKKTGSFTVNIALIENRQPTVGVIYVPATGVCYYGGVDHGAFVIHPEPTALAAGEPTALAAGEPTALAAGSDRPGDAAEPEASAYGSNYQPPGASPRFPETTSRSDSASPAPGSRPPATGHRISVSPVPETPRFVASRDHAGPEVKRMLESFEGAECLSIGSSLKFCLVAEGRADGYLRDVPTMEWDTAAAHAILRAAGGHLLTWPDLQPLTYGKPDWKNPSLLSVGQKDFATEIKSKLSAG